MAKKEQYTELLSAELLSFSNKNTSHSVSSSKCSHVKIQKIDKERHRIVVVNESIEVSSYVIDDITQLHHIEEENCVKWSDVDNVDNVWNLRLADKSNADNFVQMVKKFSKLSLQSDRTETVHVYSSVTNTDSSVPEENKSINLPFPSQISIEAKSFITQLTSSLSKSGVVHTGSSETNPVESKNEAMSLVNDIDNDGVLSDRGSKLPSNDHDEVPVSSVAVSNDQMFESSTPTGDYPPNIADEGPEMVKTSVSFTDLIVPGAFVPGIEQNIPQNESRTKKNKPPSLPTMDDLSAGIESFPEHHSVPNSLHGSATPLTDLSAASERSTLNRGAACYFNSSRGADDDDEGFQMELNDIYYRYYNKMVLCYKKTFNSYWSKHSTNSISKTHKVIAALVCQNRKSCYTAVLSTGRYHNDAKKCGSTTTCDGHAVSICYEAAPKYFMEEILSLKNGEDSIFEFLPNREGFRLKSGISFHLLVTKFPCGFLHDQKDPCMEWKLPFVGYPHVPTCSSRILIGATMGIQGYISHLIDKPIMIDTLVILCPDLDKNQIIDVGNFFKMPVIKTMKYDPKHFAPGFFLPSKHSPNTSFSEDPNYQYMVSHESTDGNETAVSEGPGLEGVPDSAVIVTTPDRCARSAFVSFDPRSTKEKCSHYDFSIKTRDIDSSFEVDEGLKSQRISRMKVLYNDLANHLKIEEALEMLRVKLNIEVKKKDEIMLSLIQSVSTELTEVVPDTLGINTISEQEWSNYIQKQVETRVRNIREEGRTKIRQQDMITCIQTILTREREKITMDCNWHQYLYAIPSSFQPTSDEEEL